MKLRFRTLLGQLKAARTPRFGARSGLGDTTSIPKQHLRGEAGITLMELLVGITLFGVVGGTLSGAVTSTLRKLGRENRLAAASEGLSLAMSVLGSELKASAHVSPYLVGTNAQTTSCRTSVVASSNKITFLIVHDDQSAPNGLRALKVGYIYDAPTKTLYRGEIAASSVFTCALPGTDPTLTSSRSPIAERVIQIDYDGNGSMEPIFSLTGTSLTVTLGTEVLGEDGVLMIQKSQTIIDVRNARII